MDSLGHEVMPIDVIDLQRMQLRSMIAMDDQLVLQYPTLKQWRDEALRHLVLQLQGHVWAEAPKSIRAEYPSTWWDAFKERWFPAWALEAYPVNYTILTLEGQIFYPRLPQMSPENTYHLRMAINRDPAHYVHFGRANGKTQI